MSSTGASVKGIPADHSTGLKLTCTELGKNYRRALDAQIDYLKTIAEGSVNAFEALQSAEDALVILERDMKLIEVE